MCEEGWPRKSCIDSDSVRLSSTLGLPPSHSRRTINRHVTTRRPRRDSSTSTSTCTRSDSSTSLFILSTYLVSSLHSHPTDIRTQNQNKNQASKPTQNVPPNPPRPPRPPARLPPIKDDRRAIHKHSASAGHGDGAAR